MPDTQKLRDAVNHFAFWARPSGNDYQPCTCGDLNKAITEMVRLANAIISELENEPHY